MADIPTERPPAADEVELLLQRAAPGEVEKEELISETGLPNDELREAIDWLREHGNLEDTENGYRLPEGSASGEAPADEHEPEHEPEHEEEPGPALTAHVRSHFEVVCSFGRKPGETDDASLAKSQTIAAEIGNALSMALPKLDFHVSVLRVDAFDSPRPLFPADEG